MKKLLPVILLFITLSSTAQIKKIDSFLGVKLGSSRAQVIAALKLKGGTLDKKNSTAEILVFDNIKLGDREPDYLYVSFINDKASTAGFVFQPELEAKTIEFYEDLVADVSKVYGEGDPIKEFKTPYEDGDGYETTAIQTGKATYKTFWGKDDDNQPGAIMAYITNKLSVLLTYHDKKLSALDRQRTEQKQKADF